MKNEVVGKLVIVGIGAAVAYSLFGPLGLILCGLILMVAK